jgi:hypothetical protein
MKTKKTLEKANRSIDRLIIISFSDEKEKTKDKKFLYSIIIYH